MRKPKYLIAPGMVTSKVDGDRHHVGASQLMMLYNVSPLDCIVLPPSAPTNFLVRRELIDRVIAGELVALTPQFSGVYEIPKGNANEPNTWDGKHAKRTIPDAG